MLRAPQTNPLPAVLWATLVAVVLLTPGSLAETTLSWARWWEAHHGDKIVHLALFFGQAFWLSGLLTRQERLSPGWFAAGLSALFGLVLECAQLAVPGRGFELTDVAANTAGALLWPLVSRLLPRR